jgi:hypothetical protein
LALVSIACAVLHFHELHVGLSARQPHTIDQIRTAPGGQWTRIEGFAAADQMTQIHSQFQVSIRPMVKAATAAGRSTVNAMMEDPT